MAAILDERLHRTIELRAVVYERELRAPRYHGNLPLQGKVSIVIPVVHSAAFGRNQPLLVNDGVS